MLPNYQEDETVHQETLENLGGSLPTGKHKRIVLTMEGLEGPNTQDKLSVSWLQLATTSRT